MNGTNPNHAPSLIEQKPKKQSFVNGFGVHLNNLADTMEQPSPATPGTGSDSTTEPDYGAMLLAAEIRVTDAIEEPPVCLSIQHGDEQFVIGTLGNFSLVIGKAKSRKTFAVGTAIAAAVKQDRILNRFVGNLPDDQQTVLYFDTEQSRHHVQRAVKRICSLCEIPEPDNLKTYSLRSLLPMTRLELIRWAIYHTPGVGLVIIDGIRDLVYDPNDAETASHCASNLLKWTEELQIHILTVLHQNKGDTNARGHLGTELVNKAETVISISRDTENRDVSVVAPEYCRDKDFEPFAFSIDELGLPYLIDEVPIKTDTDAKKRTSTDLKSDEVQTIIRRAFSSDEQLRYSQLRINLMEASEYIGATLGKSRAETLITRIVSEKYITKHKHVGQQYELYQINPEKLPG